MIKLLKIQTDSKIDLKIQTEKMRNRKRINEWNRINQLFAKSPKQVYREFKSNDTFKIENPPTAEHLKNFWGGIWQKDSTFNEEAAWLKDLREIYCEYFVEKQHKIDENVVKKIISRFHNNKAPGLDLIIAYWMKYSTSLYKFIATIYEKSTNKEIQFPSWLITTKTILTAKNQFLSEAKTIDL